MYFFSQINRLLMIDESIRLRLNTEISQHESTKHFVQFSTICSSTKPEGTLEIEVTPVFWPSLFGTQTVYLINNVNWTCLFGLFSKTAFCIMQNCYFFLICYRFICHCRLIGPIMPYILCDLGIDSLRQYNYFRLSGWSVDLTRLTCLTSRLLLKCFHKKHTKCIKNPPFAKSLVHFCVLIQCTGNWTAPYYLLRLLPFKCIIYGYSFNFRHSVPVSLFTSIVLLPIVIIL